MSLYGTIPFLLLFFFGYGYVGLMSILQTASGRRLISFYKRPLFNGR